MDKIGQCSLYSSLNARKNKVRLNYLRSKLLTKCVSKVILKRPAFSQETKIFTCYHYCVIYVCLFSDIGQSVHAVAVVHG